MRRIEFKLIAASTDFVKRQRTDTPAGSAPQCHPRIWAFHRLAALHLFQSRGSSRRSLLRKSRAKLQPGTTPPGTLTGSMCAQSKPQRTWFRSLSVVLTRTGDSETSKSGSSLVSPWQTYNFVLPSSLYKRGPFISALASHTCAFATSRSRICFVPAGLVARIGKCDPCSFAAHSFFTMSTTERDAIGLSASCVCPIMIAFGFGHWSIIPKDMGYAF